MTTVRSSERVALARAALAGNPSDGYGGAVLAVTLPKWRARAQAMAAGGTPIRIDPANELVQATAERFRRELRPTARGTAIRWDTSIPQRVGLGSSSALVIAVTRALCDLHDVELDPPRLAEFALAVETEDLGIEAGPQDRVAQAYEGLVYMEFSDPPRYVRLDPGLLPVLVIAWHDGAAAHSGGVHGDLRRRHRRGDSAVHEAMGELAAVARRARDALVKGDRARFGGCVDRTFDLRRELMALDPLCVEMVETARGAGANANYTGSGGAIVSVCRDQAQAEVVASALQRLGCGVAGV